MINIKDELHSGLFTETAAQESNKLDYSVYQTVFIYLSMMNPVLSVKRRIVDKYFFGVMVF